MELRKRHRGHARALKNLDERYDWYADAIELDAAACKGSWISKHCPAANRVYLDLGCGKGQFIANLAGAHPDVLFVGIDYDRTCIALAAQKVHELELSNCIFALADGEDVCDYFADGELARIYLNFSTPHPRKKHAQERLTYVDQLIAYRRILADDACIDLKTDSPPFYDFSLIQFDLAAYDIIWSTQDLYASDDASNQIAHEFASTPITEYEERLCKLGAKVHALRAIKTGREYTHEQTATLSLFDYMPDDLSTLDYIPFGMEGYVFNTRNRRAKEQARIVPND